MNYWIQEYGSCTSLDPSGKSFRMIILLSKHRTDSWGCSLVSLYYLQNFSNKLLGTVSFKWGYDINLQLNNLLKHFQKSKSSGVTDLTLGDSKQSQVKAFLICQILRPIKFAMSWKQLSFWETRPLLNITPNRLREPTFHTTRGLVLLYWLMIANPRELQLNSHCDEILPSSCRSLITVCINFSQND